MDPKTKLITFIIVVTFGTGIVAVGAHELNLRYWKKGKGSGKTAVELVKGLQGEIQPPEAVRAQFGEDSIGARLMRFFSFGSDEVPAPHKLHPPK